VVLAYFRFSVSPFVAAIKSVMLRFHLLLAAGSPSQLLRFLAAQLFLTTFESFVREFALLN
jgi:hypothetical protein